MTELLKLKAENLTLKIANFNMSVKVEGDKLNASQKALEAEILKDEPEGSAFDWNTLTVTPPKA